MSVSKRNIALVLLLVAIGVAGYLINDHVKGLNEQISVLAGARSADRAVISRSRELAAMDSLLIAGRFAEARTAYQAARQDSGGTDSTLLDVRIAHAERAMSLRYTLDTMRRNRAQQPLPPPPAFLPLPAPASPPVNLTALADSVRIDSLRNALVVAQQQAVKLRQEKARPRTPTHLTFTSREGNEVYYVGDIVNGKATGQGAALLSTGSRYDGEWRNNQKHGSGTFHWSDGARYEGSYADDRRNGQGTYFFPDGSKFVGEWVGDRRHGEGTFYNKKGKAVTRGTWAEDELVKRRKK